MPSERARTLDRHPSGLRVGTHGFDCVTRQSRDGDPCNRIERVKLIFDVVGPVVAPGLRSFPYSGCAGAPLPRKGLGARVPACRRSGTDPKGAGHARPPRRSLVVAQMRGQAARCSWRVLGRRRATRSGIPGRNEARPLPARARNRGGVLSTSARRRRVDSRRELRPLTSTVIRPARA